LEGDFIKPPYGSVSAFKKFLDLLDKVTIEKVTTEIVRKYNLCSEKNEYKLVNGLRFLGLINENGEATEKLRALQLEGKLGENLNKVLRETYNKIFDKVNLEKASREILINSFMTEYKMGKGTAREGARIFVYLCQRAGIPLSKELQTTLKPREKIIRRKKERQAEEIGEEKPKSIELDLENMIEIKFGDDILIYLRKGDKTFREKIANRAKTLIDFYVEGL